MLERPQFADVARWLPPAPAVLYQTYKKDYGPAAEMCERHIQELVRHFMDDAGCRDDVAELGGQWLVDRYESFSRGSHRCDVWRYIHLHATGGSYLDIKMALARPWAETEGILLEEADATGAGQMCAQRCQRAGQGLAQLSGEAGNQSLARVRSVTSTAEQGQGLAQRSGTDGDQSLAQASAVGAGDAPVAPIQASMRTTPYLVLSIGANKKHIYQGNIWNVSRSHPLLTHAVQEVLRTEPARLKKRYTYSSASSCGMPWNVI